MTGQYERFGALVDRCESPLERRFLVALLFSDQFTFVPTTDDGGVAVAEDGYGVVLGQQVPVGAYRLDFAMKVRGSGRRVAVEIDGARFHDHPDQVHRDRVRDRMLLAIGWTTIRFTGKDIMQDALGCAKEAYALALRVCSESSSFPLAKASGVGPYPLTATR